jgi:hypothetical protein
MISEFTFTLSSPVKYHDAGQIAEGFELLLKAPSNKNRIESAKLKQGFFRALKGMADNRGNVDTDAAESKDSTISGSEVVSVIMMSDVDLSEYQENFRQLLLNGVCFVGSEKLTTPMFDSLSDSDTEKLMGEYIANFLLASHLSKMATK